MLCGRRPPKVKPLPASGVEPAAALDRGARSVKEMLDDAWSDAPAHLRPAATWTLTAHLDKLDQEGRLPADVERPPENALPGGA